MCVHDEIVNPNSMINWWAKVQDLPIPMPKTLIVELNMSYEDKFGILDGEKASADAWDVNIPAIQEAILAIGIPVFIRTDLTSGKHEWVETCFLNNAHELRHHISALVNCSAMADMIGLNMDAIVVREYIPMATGFLAFSGKMPVNPERRYFVKDGEVVCHHPYWIQEAVEEGTKEKALPTNWKATLETLNAESESEIELLTNYAELVGARVDGYWSVDFCKAQDGRWIFIDMAKGEASWHPECEKKEPWKVIKDAGKAPTT